VKNELQLAFEPEADRLISEDPFALLVGMVLDQQIPLEKAFRGPLELQRRMGELSPSGVAAAKPEELADIFAQVPSLHRYPRSMATRVQALARIVSEEYGGRAEQIWLGASDAADLLGRLKRLPGFGDHKARIFVALLGKQLGVTPAGWQEVSSPFSEEKSRRSVADIVDDQSLGEVRTFKADMKAAHKAEAAARAPSGARHTGKARSKKRPAEGASRGNARKHRAAG